MPGGSEGGAKAGGRFYRGAALAIGATPTQIELDENSVQLEPNNVELDTGDMKTLVAGRGIVLFSMKGEGVSSLSGFRIVMTRSPGTARELIFVDAIRRAPQSGNFTTDAGGAVDLDVDDTIRIEAAVQGIAGPFSLATGDLNCWAHLILA